MTNLFPFLIGSVFLACGDEESTDTGRETLDTGAPCCSCEEVGRTVVTDSSVATAPLTFAADEALAIAVGDFVGTALLRDAAGAEIEVDAWWSVVAPVEILAIDLEVEEDTGGGETDGSLGAPSSDPQCRDYYVAVTSGRLRTEGEPGYVLDEAWEAELVLLGPEEVSLGWSVDIAALNGDFRPDFDPADYDTAVLDVWASASLAGWEGDMQWSASRDLGDGMGEGVVGPAGSFTVRPATE